MQFCPQCHLILEPATWHDASILVCRSCGGVCFAATDFGALYPRDRAAFSELNTLFPGLIDSSSAAAYAGLPKACPGCRTTQMEPAPLSLDTDITPDICTRCGAVWLEPADRSLMDSQALSEASPTPTEEVLPPHEPEGSITVPSDAEPEPEPVIIAPPDLETENGPAVTVEVVPDAVEPSRTFVFKSSPEMEANITAYVHGWGKEKAPDLPARASVPGVKHLPQPEPTPEEDVEEVLAELADTDQDSCCPVCLTVYASEQSACPKCRCQLVDPDFRVWCPQCRVENNFAAERCSGCRKPLRTPEMLAQLYGAEPPRTLPEGDHGLAAGIPLTPTVVNPSPIDVRWCPQCRKRFPANLSLCVDCMVGLVAGSYRIRCLHCENANAISADNCWSCQLPLHPSQSNAASGLHPSAAPTPPPPALAPPRSSLRPGPSGSCGTVLLLKLLAILHAGMLVYFLTGHYFHR